MNEKIEELRKLFAGQYPEYFGAKAGALSFGYVTNSDEVVWRPSNGCHGFIRGVCGFKAIYSSLWCRYPDLYEAALDYWDYLCKDPNGPWSKTLKDIEFLYTDDGKPIAVGTRNLDNLTSPTIAMFIQCRVPQEMANKLRSYWVWRKAGFSRPESLYLSEYIAVHINGALSLINETYTHMFDINLCGISYPMLENANPKVVLRHAYDPSHHIRSLRNGCSYSNLAMMWSDDKFTVLKRKKVFADLLKGTPSYNGLFEKVFELNKQDFFKSMPNLVSKHEAVVILFNNKDKWKL